jgi:purine-binding chemotaxis protein CheW
MGRMTDARKRARKGTEGKEGPTGKEPAPPPAPLLVIDDPPVPARSSSRIELPSSGLAADILAREEARQVETVALRAPVAPAPVPAVAPPRPLESPAQSLSFFSAPVQEARAAVEATEHLATFNLDQEEYGVEVRLVQEIRRVSEITVVPRAPEFIKGVINLRGRILPVVDLKRKLGLGDVVIQKESRIVVVRLKERLLGLLVDGASQVLKVPLSRIESAPGEILDKGGETIRGVAKLDNRLVILLDLNRVLAQELKEVDR